MINITDSNFNALKSVAEQHRCDVFENASLKNYTSFKTGGECPLLITPKTREALSAVLKAAKAFSVPFVILGNGSNVLAPDEGLKKAVIKIADGLTEIIQIVAILNFSKSKIIDSPLENRDFHIFLRVFLNF